MSESQFITYAQNGEDVLLWRALKHVQKGFYIDVGAQDPVDDSVTKAFYERGWHGINVEPVPRWHDRLVLDRPHDINLRLAVSNQPGVVTLFEVENSGLSTSDPEFARRHETEGHVLREFAVECKTLDQVCAEHEVGTVHFLKIDCEGAEKQALEGASLSKTRPWIILLEATEPNSSKSTWQQWEHLLTGRGYRFVFFDGLNRYYLAEEHMNLATAFEAPVNILDGMQRIAEVDAMTRLAQLRGELEGLKSVAVSTALRAEVVALTTERNGVMAERDRAVADRNRVTAERDRVTAERDRVMAERDKVTTERDGIMIERDALMGQCKGVTAERDGLQARQLELLASGSWRVTAPMRGVSLSARWVLRRARAMAGGILRRCVRKMRPLLRRLSKNLLARKLAVSVLGKHSRVTESARLFLYGTVQSGNAATIQLNPTQEDERLRRTLQSVFADLQEGRKDATAACEAFDPDRVMEQVRTEVTYRLAHRLLQ